MPVFSTPPLLPPVFGILVAGHRAERLTRGGADNAALQTGIEAALEHAAEAAEAVFTRPPYDGSKSTIRIITGASDGTDAMVAAIARGEPERYALKVVSPLTQRYCEPDAHCPVWLAEEAVALRDHIALAHADLVVVVWDGQAPAGFRGGTVRILQQAALAAKIVLWIDMRGECRLLDERLLTSAVLVALDTLDSDPATLASLFVPCDWARVGARIAELLAPALLFSGKKKPRDAQARYVKEYFDSARVRPARDDRAGSIDAILTALVLLNPAKLAAATRGVTAPRAGIPWIKPDWPATLPPLKSLDRFFAWSDLKANIAAGHRRSNIWLISLLSALAVLFGALGPLVGEAMSHNLAILELIAIIAVIVLFSSNRMRGVHQHWLFHRWLAEQLRVERTIMPVDGVHPVMLRGPWLVAAPLAEAPQKPMTRSWRPTWGQRGKASPPPMLRAQDWLLQRVLIAEDFDFVGAERSGTDLEGFVSTTIALLKEGLSDQQNYHRGKSGLLHRLHRHLDWLAILAFIATAAAVLGHLFFSLEWAFVLTTFLPSAGAAFTGITEQLEAAPLAGQSEQTSEVLAAYGGALEHLAKFETQGQSWRLVWRLLEVRRIGQKAVGVMAGETEGWRSTLNYREARLG